MVGYIVAILLVLFVFHYRSQRNSSCINWPFLGMLPGPLWNASRIQDYITQVLRESEWTFEFKGPWFSNSDYLITSDPANANQVLSKNSVNYLKGNDFKEGIDLMGDGVFTTDGETWKSHRTIFHSFIKNRKFTNFFMKTISHKMENDLIPILEHFSELGIEFDMQDIFQRFTFDNISSLVLGFDPKCLALDFPKVEYEKALHVMEETLYRRLLVPKWFWKLQRWLGVGLEKKYARAGEVFDEFLCQRISLKRQQLCGSEPLLKPYEEENFDILTAYIMEEKENGGSLGDEFTKSDKLLRDNAFSLVIAGRDVLSATLSWLFWLVATHPDAENRIVQEIKSKVKVNEQGKKMFSSMVELNKLLYLHGAICETVRLFPAIPFLPRFSVLEPETLPSGFHADKNTRVLISVYAMGRMESIWGKDCLEFKPERWISEQGEIVHVPSYNFMGFGAGPRSCIGKDLSLVQLKMVAAAVIWNYHVKLVEGHRVVPRSSSILHMEQGLKVRISKRCF